MYRVFLPKIFRFGVSEVPFSISRLVSCRAGMAAVYDVEVPVVRVKLRRQYCIVWSTGSSIIFYA